MHKNNNSISIRFRSSFYSCFLISMSFICILCSLNLTHAQSRANDGVKVFHFTSRYTCFPEASRSAGFTYESQPYDFASHYSDSSVIMVVPANYTETSGSVDIIFWFHGWHNNIDTALDYYHLALQFKASHRNAILVLPEAAKNAPDSYGGKLEQQDVFRRLVQDVLQNLRDLKIISSGCTAGHIILAGHSGAYRVISYILQNGGVSVQEVELFDALYGQTDKFYQWIQDDTSNRFVNLFTNTGGGTDEVSAQMMDELKKQQHSFLFAEENTLTGKLLQSARIVFIHSSRQHNDIIFNPDNFKLFLQSSPFLVDSRN
jgi:hypothetical protein